MKNKTFIIASVIFILISYLVYRGFVVYYLIFEVKKLLKSQTADIFEKDKKIKSIWKIKKDDNNFPEYAKKFVPDEKFSSYITDINNYIYGEKNIYDSYFQNKLLDKTKNIIPNNLFEYKYTLIPCIKNMMRIPKKNKQPTFEEYFKLPAINTKCFSQSVTYWFALSRYFEVKNQDYETSLLLGLSIFYLSKDFISNYAHSFTALNRASCIGFYSKACDSILIWASKPKIQFGNLSKIVSKDILDFVKNEYSLSSLLENIKISNDIDLKMTFNYFSNRWLNNYPNSKSYKELIYILYEKPLNFIDKPIYEIENELAEMECDLNKLYYFIDSIRSEPVKSILKLIFTTEEVVASNIVASFYPNMKKLKRNYEDTLAKMEFTAIALAINSFYSEKNRLPSSIEELSSWFGQDLPINRLNGKPYKLDLEGKYLLRNREYNFGIDNLVFNFIR